MAETLVNINRLETPKHDLENLRIGKTIDAPRNQRASIKQAIARIKDECHKRYSIKTMSDYHITIKRIQ